MLKSWAGIISLAAMAGAGGLQAHADDAYVCDGGRLVYARPETLEKLKKTDPCIASYYRQNTVPVAVPALREPSITAGTVDAVASEKTPSIAPNGGNVNLKTAPVRPDLLPALKEKMPLAKRVKPPAAKPPQSASGTDYRNITIINAPQGQASIYRHER